MRNIHAQVVQDHLKAIVDSAAENEDWNTVRMAALAAWDMGLLTVNKMDGDVPIDVTWDLLR
jgi:hypothetical protein